MLYGFYKTGRLRGVDTILLLSSLLPQLLLMHFSLTYSHSIDLFDHLDYLKRVYENFAMPDPTGWRLQQPPFYYYYLAVALRFLDLFKLDDPISDLRYFSHLLFVLYAVYCVRIIRLQDGISDSIKLLCIALLIFWPSIQFSAVRINNDTGFFLYFAMMYFYLSRWFQKQRNDDFAMALACASLSLLCKGTGVLSLAVIGIAWIYYVSRNRLEIKSFLRPNCALMLAYGITAGALAIYFGRITLYNALHGESIKYFANLDDNYGGQPVSLVYFLSFSWQEFLTDFGYINWDTRPFWNSFFTAQIYNYCLEPARLMDRTVLSVSHLVLFLIGLAGSLRGFIGKGGHTLSLITIFCLIGGVILQRSMTMDGHMASGRYVFPLLIIIVAEYGRITSAMLKSRYYTFGRLLTLPPLILIGMSGIHWMKL